MNVMGIAILGDLLRSPRTRVAIFSHFPGSLLARVSEKLKKKKYHSFNSFLVILF